jgi:hypothetical protein
MKNNLLILSILSSCILSSCNTTKQLHQVKTNITTETSTHETTITNSQTISTTKVIESQDTSVLVKGSELTSSANFNNLLSGDTIFATGENLLLKTFYDSLTKTIKTQATTPPHSVSFKYQKITEKNELQIGSVTSTKQYQQKQMVQSEKKDKEITRSSFPWWLIVIIIVVVIGIIGWAILKFKLVH